MDKQEIMLQLEKIIKQRGGKYKSEVHDKLGSVSQEYKNEYEDDGSMSYEKLKMAVVKNIAQVLFEPVGPDDKPRSAGVKEMKAVPESSIKKVMAALHKKRQLAIDKLHKEDKFNRKALDVLSEDDKLVKNLRRLKMARNEDIGKDYDQYKYPELEEYDTGYAPKTIPSPKIPAKLLRQAARYFDRDTTGDVATYKTQIGLGLKKKKAPSKYNLFVKNYFRKHQGATMSDAANAWRRE
jgi:hypothetical protein